MVLIKRKVLNKFQLEKIINQRDKCICKIIKSNEIYGTGFLCKIPFPDSNYLLPVLMIESHLLSLDKSVEGQIIQFTMKEGKLSFKISLDINRIAYTSYKYNITFIEIKENDGLDISSFLEIDEQIFSSNINKNIDKIDIYLIHPEEYTYSIGII